MAYNLRSFALKHHRGARCSCAMREEYHRAPRTRKGGGSISVYRRRHTCRAVILGVEVLVEAFATMSRWYKLRGPTGPTRAAGWRAPVLLPGGVRILPTGKRGAGDRE